MQGNFIRVKLSGSLLKFSSLYSNERIFIRLLVILIISIVSALIGVIFVQNTGLYNVGFESLAQGIGRLVSYLITSENPFEFKEIGYVVFNSLFWSLIIVVNIPLIIFGWFKIGKKFTIYTSIYIVLSSLMGLSFGFIKELENFFVFSDLTPELIYKLNNVQITEWNAALDATKQLAIFIYGFIYGILQALCYAVLFIIGCSSGSLDFFVVWYAEKKYKDLGTIFTYCNIFCFVISYIMGTYIPASLTLQHVNDSISSNFINSPSWLKNNLDLQSQYKEFQKLYEKGTGPFSWDILFSPNFLSTIIMSIVLGLVINLYFPKYQMCRIELHTKHASEIRDHLISQNKPYSISIYTIEGGYSRKPQSVLVTNCMFMDASNLLEIVREHDPNALFVVSLIKSIDGYVYLLAKKEEKLAIVKLFEKFKSKFKSGEKLLDESPHEIELEENKKLDNDLDFIEASEVYDKKLESEYNKKRKSNNEKKEKNK